MLHALSTSIPSPRQFTYPFCYDVDPLAEAASLELQRYIADADLMSTEKGCGKMFGVLVVESLPPIRVCLAVGTTGLTSCRPCSTRSSPTAISSARSAR